MRNRRGALALALAGGLLWSAPIPAATWLGHTRLIVSEQAREATTRVVNEGRTPVLIQAWVDTGEEAPARVEDLAVPFLVDPPVFRLDPGQSRHLRVLMTRPGPPLSNTEESLFWLNVLEVPPVAAGASHQVQISVRTSIKLFYRPAALAARRSAEADRLRFGLTADGRGGTTLNIENPSPWHRSFDAITVLTPDGQPVSLEPLMLVPGQRVRLPVPPRGGALASQDGWRVRFALIDDQGVVSESEESLRHR